MLDKHSQVSVGDLYLQLGNLSQADSWLVKASQIDGAADQRLQSGLLKLAIGEKDWPAAEKQIAALDKSFPDFLDNSELKSARQELMEWRTKREAAERALAEQTAAIEAQTSNDNNPEEILENQIENSTIKNKASLSEEVATAENLALTPAVEYYQPPSEPIDSPDAESADKQIDRNNQTELAPPSPSPNELIAEVIAQAEQAEINNDRSQAIELYWDAIAIDNQRATIWGKLAQAYRNDQQLKNAESTALEAIRLDTNNINYTLDYLRIIQNSKAPKDFLAELETAHARFPLSPEITLSLARAYHKMSKDTDAAQQFYQRFIEIAPAHPLRSEAESALQTLQ